MAHRAVLVDDINDLKANAEAIYRECGWRGNVYVLCGAPELGDVLGVPVTSGTLDFKINSHGKTGRLKVVDPSALTVPMTEIAVAMLRKSDYVVSDGSGRVTLGAFVGEFNNGHTRLVMRLALIRWLKGQGYDEIVYISSAQQPTSDLVEMLVSVNFRVAI